MPSTGTIDQMPVLLELVTSLFSKPESVYERVVSCVWLVTHLRAKYGTNQGRNPLLDELYGAILNLLDGLSHLQPSDGEYLWG
jgi:hypothetical protein